jgi:hypothetical protein
MQDQLENHASTLLTAQINDVLGNYFKLRLQITVCSESCYLLFFYNM